MADHRRVLLYGNSIILGSVGASLQRAGGFELTQVSPPLPGVSELETLDPEVILFDAENGEPDAAFALLRNRPGLLLLSVDPDGNIVRLWSERQYQELSTMDLAALIEAGSLSGVDLDEPPANTRARGTER
jgi:hypothetical protein